MEFKAGWGIQPSQKKDMKVVDRAVYCTSSQVATLSSLNWIYKLKYLNVFNIPYKVGIQNGSLVHKSCINKGKIKSVYSREKSYS